MAHIENKEELIKLRQYVRELYGEHAERNVIKEILNEIVPKNNKGKLLTGVVVTESSLPTVSYMPNSNTINISRRFFEKTANESAKILSQVQKVEDFQKLVAYYRLFALLHEREHSYQFLISGDILPFNYREVAAGYKNIVSVLLKKDHIIPRPIKQVKEAVAFFKYNKNAYSYILERNASSEAAKDIVELAKSESENDIEKIFTELKEAMEFIGYENNNQGCMYYAHKGLWLLNKYNKTKKDDSMTEEDRFRFGLEIEDETRNKFLAKIKKSDIIL